MVLLNKLCTLGYYAKHLKQFVQRAPRSARGFYLMAFCNGLGEIMDEYADTVVDVERLMLRDSWTSLLYVQHRLEKYSLLFPSLQDMVDHVRNSKVHGCNILDVLRKWSISGTPILIETLDRITCHVRRVLVRQSARWMIRGDAHDPFDEFFVCSVRQDHLESRDADGAPSDPPESVDCSYGYCLRVEMIPECIPVSLARKILFAGTVVRVFSLSKFPLDRPTYGDKEEEFTRRIAEMEDRCDLPLWELQHFVEEIRFRAASYLWYLFVEENDLLSQLHLLRNTFLLGFGDLYQDFVEAADKLLSLPPDDNTEFEANDRFEMCSEMLRLEEELADRLSVVIRLPPGNASAPVSGWDCLGLSYDVRYPLHIFLAPSVMAKYDRLFRFLLTVRRTQVALHGYWLRHTKEKEDQWDASLLGIWLDMNCLVESLHYYLQVDVVESNFDNLLRTITSTRDVESVQHAHSNYLANLLAGTFVLLKPVHEHIHRALDLCRTFCDPLTRGHGNLDAIVTDFETERYLLFRIVHTLASSEPRLHLSQLMLRLDYSSYYCSQERLYRWALLHGSTSPTSEDDATVRNAQTHQNGAVERGDGLQPSGGPVGDPKTRKAGQTRRRDLQSEMPARS